MNLRGNFLVFLAGLLSSTWAHPHLEDNGYRDILVYVGHDVPDEDANTVIEMIKELLTVASEDMYYANQGRVYIHEVTIVVPNHWTTEMVPSLSGETVRGEIFKEADIQIGRMNNLTGEAPYTQQIRGECGAPEIGESGQPIQVSLEYLKGLHSKRDEMIVNYGPMGKLIAQEFAKYHHGIYEEYGYPGKQDVEENAEQFPSLYLHSFMDQDGVRKMAAVPNYCADMDLKGDTRNYKLVGDHLVHEACVIDDDTGEIISPSCYFHADATGQEAVSSIGSYQYTDEVTLFCDGSEYLPHNQEAPNLHNDYCEGASQWETIVSHREFANGNNPPVWIEDTTPTFYTKSQASARFVLVIDYSKSMQSHHRIEHLKTSAIRWITQLKPGTYVAIVKFCDKAKIVHDWVEADKAQSELINAINAIKADCLGTNMASGLKMAEEVMLDSNAPGHAGVVMTLTDGEVNQGTDVGDAAVWGPFKRNSIRVLTVLMGTKKNSDLETLSRETKGKVFTVNYDGSNLDGPFDWASQTYIPPEMADRYEWTITDVGIPGITANWCGFRCANASMLLDDQTNKDVIVAMRLQAEGEVVDIADYIEMANVKDLVSGNNVDGYKYSVDSKRKEALLKNKKPNAGNFLVDMKFKKRIGVRFFAQVKVTGHRSSPNSEPYVVECQYPSELTEKNKFLITGQVKQGNTVVKGATLFARISKSMDEDSTGKERSCIQQLKDDGLVQYTGDTRAFDGVHSYIMDPRDCWDYFNSSLIPRMQVMCTMVSNPDTQVTDNEFFTKREVDTKGLPSDNDRVVPYCCGTSNQTWSSNREVEHVGRNTYNTSFKNELNIRRKDWFTADFGPPGRIADLKATRVGDERSGIVELKWTGAGDDPAYGTPASYNVHYSTKRSNLYTKNLKMSSRVTSAMLTTGSLKPVPIGGKMGITVSIPDLEVPGTYHFAVRAVDNHGQEGKASNIVTVNFHDGSPVVKDMSPLQVHGIQKADVPLTEKLRKIYPDERMVQGYLKKAAKTKQMVWEAENSVMEKRLRKRFRDNEKVLANIINTIKNNPEQRNLYKKILL